MSNEQTRYGESLPTPASTVKVIPQELWDVGVSLQSLRDALLTMMNDGRDAAQRLPTYDVAGDLTEVNAAWRQLAPALGDPVFGLAIQTKNVVGVLDEMMSKLRATIIAYEESERESTDRLRSVGAGESGN